MKTLAVIYLVVVASLLAGAFLVFRVLVRKDYRQNGKLTMLSSLLELVVCLAYACVPYLYNPPCWPYIWSCKPHSPMPVALLGYLVIASGVLLGFGSMLWLGIARSFGRKVTDLYHTGPYRYSRNPQVVGGFLMAAGIALLWPSWYALGWAISWMAMFHLMVLTEEEHLTRVYGEAYLRYFQQAPRYIPFRFK